jgi:hypothetical protein
MPDPIQPNSQEPLDQATPASNPTAPEQAPATASEPVIEPAASPDPNIAPVPAVVPEEASSSVSPSNPSPLEPKKSNKKIIIIIVSVVAALVTIAAIAALSWVFISRNNNSSTQKTNLDSTSSPKTSSYGGLFVLPTDGNGWKGSEISSGIYQYKSSTKDCQITISTQAGANKYVSGGGTVDSEAKLALDQLKASTTSKDLKVVDTGTFTVKDPTGGSVKLTTSEYTYTGNDGVAYTGEIGLAFVDDYALVIQPTCTTQDWGSSKSILSDFIAKIELLY